MEENNLYTPQSLLDTDLYKFTMQHAIGHHFPETRALYRFTHRDPDVLFPRRCIDLLHKSIQRFGDLRLTTEEKNWLANTCPYFPKEYLEYLSEFRFDPAQISIRFNPVSEDGEEGRVEIEASGLWRETILWEVPVMACLSELYFRVGATDWSYEGQKEIASAKAQAWLQAGCIFSEFGTRRRRSFNTQDLVVAALKQEADRSSGPGVFFGTSNPYFAKKYGIRVVGTIAHEWFMGIAALKGYEGANINALALWEETYPNGSFVALTDTFSTRVFFQELAKDPARAEKWSGLRQDSGNPFEFAPAAKAMYESIGIDIRTKNIIYSDGLNSDKVLQLKKHCDDIGFGCSFGIGTNLTNDFKTKSSGYTEKSKALNMVIKLAKVDDEDCVKISDDLSKNTGDKALVACVKKLYGIPN
ncbi:Quinolinate phosphoribosyl transferase [Boletus edulis BED1]|uniref:Nicotinate phosphoribosyltransferase n=1 Tax=Boletus edulis BED1 TaxID=1328754 RepID=A0AAD4BKR4_BOLED|nr:Quinolinate phosphoribosyl transferase [Boletus edulis BED1]